MTNAPTRVLLLSPIGTRINPYIGLLADGLTAAGADVQRVARLSDLGPDWADEYDVIHLHWLDHYDRPPAILLKSLHGAKDLPRRVLRRLFETICNLSPIYQWRRWLGLRRLLVRLAIFRTDGGRVAYTVHNLDPHEGGGRADRWAIAQLIGLADLVHVHDARTAELLAAQYGRRAGVAVFPHGHYIDSYPNTVGRDTARESLCISTSAFVYLNLGLMRPYKGLEELIAAFRALPDPDAVLLLAGRAGADGYDTILRELAAGDARVRIVPEFVPGEEVQRYMNAADVCVLPYRSITTSGAALLAFSFGLPVIASAVGAFPELVCEGRGILFDPAAEGGLDEMLVQARAVDWSGSRTAILEWVAQFDWETIGRDLVTAYGA